jgi:hypothetical protein
VLICASHRGTVRGVIQYATLQAPEVGAVLAVLAGNHHRASCYHALRARGRWHERYEDGPYCTPGTYADRCRNMYVSHWRHFTCDPIHTDQVPAVLVACISSLRSLFTQDTSSRNPYHSNGTPKRHRPSESLPASNSKGQSGLQVREHSRADAPETSDVELQLITPFDYGNLLKANP